MKIGIVVPFSWSFWGAVVEHAELQAQALEARGHEVRLVMGTGDKKKMEEASAVLNDRLLNYAYLL